VKDVVVVFIPPGVVTAMTPLEAPAGTFAVIRVAESSVNPAAVPLNVTAVAPVRFVPVITTDVPIPPLVGTKLVIVGAAITVNCEPLVPVPPGVETEIDPDVAPAGTVAVISVAESTL
jgi:hypothetical protein